MNKTHQIGQHLMAETIKRSRGRDKPYCVGDLPSDKYYVANLSPEYGSADREEFDAKTRPSSISLECQPEADTTASVQIEFEFYVPSLPTYAEYQDIQIRRLRAAKMDAVDQFDDTGSWEDIEQDEIDRDILYTFDEPFFRRGSVAVDRDLSLDDLRQQTEDITAELNETLRAEISAITDAHPLSTATIDVNQYSAADLAELPESEFNGLCQEVPTLDPTDLKWDVRFRASMSEGELVLTLSNHPPDPAAAEPNDGPGDRYIFNPKISLTAPLEPYTFDLIPEDYRYDQHMWAKGRNCATTVDQSTMPSTVKTTGRVAESFRIGTIPVGKKP